MAFPEVEELKELIRPVTDARGLDIEAVRTVKAGKKSQVVVALAADEAPTLDQLEEVSGELSELFDAAEAAGTVNFGAGYTLEVTTPGVDLPLTQPRHWRRNRGRRVKLGGDIYRVGPLDDAEENVALISPAAKKSDEPRVRVAPISDVSGAVVEIEFNAAPEAEVELSNMSFADVEGRAEQSGAEAEVRKDDK